jgi:hypothetical protein
MFSIIVSTGFSNLDNVLPRLQQWVRVPYIHHAQQVTLCNTGSPTRVGTRIISILRDSRTQALDVRGTSLPNPRDLAFVDLPEVRQREPHRASGACSSKRYMSANTQCQMPHNQIMHNLPSDSLDASLSVPFSSHFPLSSFVLASSHHLYLTLSFARMPHATTLLRSVWTDGPCVCLCVTFACVSHAACVS